MFSPVNYLFEFGIEIVIPFVFVYVLVLFISNTINNVYMQMLLTSMLSTLLLGSYYYIFSLNKGEKIALKQLLNTIPFLK